MIHFILPLNKITMLNILSRQAYKLINHKALETIMPVLQSKTDNIYAQTCRLWTTLGIFYYASHFTERFSFCFTIYSSNNWNKVQNLHIVMKDSNNSK